MILTMKYAYQISDDMVRMLYWQAKTTFGEAAVKVVLHDPVWRAKYPKLIEQALSDDYRIRRPVILPGELVYAIAGRDECVDDFYGHPDRERLFAASRKYRGHTACDFQGYPLIPNQEALLTYGAYCLFKAADRGIGYKGERDL